MLTILTTLIQHSLAARILEWVAIPFSCRSSWPKNQTQVSSIAGRFFTIWATVEALPDFKIHWKSRIIKTIWYGNKRYTHRTMGQNWEPRNKHMIYSQFKTKEVSLLPKLLQPDTQWGPPILNIRIWNCQVDLFLFLSSCLITTKLWSDGPKGVEQQTGYSSAQLKQTDLLLVWHSHRHSPQPSYQLLLAFPFYTSSFLLLVMPSAKEGLHPPPVNERECKWAYAQGRSTIKSYITASCVVYVFP